MANLTDWTDDSQKILQQLLGGVKLSVSNLKSRVPITRFPIQTNAAGTNVIDEDQMQTMLTMLNMLRGQGR
jgi:hypothetical protein